MEKIWEALKNNPVRIYSIITAALTLAAAFGFHVSSGEQEALLGLVAALLSGGEVVRSVVTPTAKVNPPIVVNNNIEGPLKNL